MKSKNIFMLVLIIILVASIILIKNYYFTPIQKIDKSLEENYPLLKNSSYQKNYSFLDFQTAINTGELEMAVGTKEAQYRCKNGKTAKTSSYSFSGPARTNPVDGGWGEIFVIDCEEYYYIFEFPGAPGNVYGPFNK